MAGTGPSPQVTDTTARVQPAELKPGPSWLRRQIRVHGYLPETVIVVGVMALLNYAYMPAQPGFLGIEPNPFWIVILLAAGRYGFRAGLFSALLCAATYLGLVATRIGERVITLRDLMGWKYAGPAVLFVIVGVVLGLLVERHRKRVAKLEQENELLVKDNLTLKRGEEELRDVNVELAHRVVGATETLPLLYKYAKKLNSLDLHEIFTVLTELVVEVTRAEQVSIYELDGDRLVLHSRNGERRTGPDLALEPSLFDALVNKREVLSLHDLLRRNIKRQDLFLCGSLTAGPTGNVLALLAVEKLEFLRYNPATFRLFRVIVDWAGTSVEKAAAYQARPEQLRLDQAKATLLRAQRATLAPGATSAAPAVPPLAGPPTAATLRPRPTAAALAATASAGGHSARPGGLGEILDRTEESLFSSLANEELAGPTVQSEQEADPRDRALLQHLLGGELQIASAQGNPLAKLLNEIDGYVVARKGGGD